MPRSLPDRLALTLSLVCLVMLPAPLVQAETAGQGAAVQEGAGAVSALVETMQIDRVIEVLRVEGLDYGASIEDEMFPGSGGAAWTATVASIYDAGAMKAAFAGRLAEELQGEDAAIAKAVAFFGSPLGQKVLGLELQARQALQDDETEAAADLAWEDLAAKGGARVELLRHFAEVNDLIESNVMGALNANLAFYQGMAGSGAFGSDMPEDELLSNVWSQEPDIRRQTEAWVYPYLALSYSSLTDKELQDYVDFSATPEGQALNAALFAAFDAVFVPISRALGSAAALQIKGQDI